VDPSALVGLRPLIGEARFSTYLHHYQGNEALALRLYSWNIAASTALWGPLGVLEVTLRNAINAKMRDRAGREDWWGSPTTYLMERERRIIESAIGKLEVRGNSNPSADDVVAATSFGLWTGLTSEGLPRHSTLSYETTYWQPRLRHAFPHYGPPAKRKQLHRLLDDIRQIRNRIAHHEPIFKSDLSKVCDNIAVVAGYVSPEAEQYIRDSHRVDVVLAAKVDFVSVGSGCHF